MQATLLCLIALIVSIFHAWAAKDIALQVSINWDMFSSWDGQTGDLAASVTVDYDWNFTLMQTKWGGSMENDDLREAVSITNFGTGNPGRVKLMNLVYGGMRGMVEGQLRRRAGMTYVGIFAQSIDGTCIPWDTQQVTMQLAIPGMYSDIMEMELYCATTQKHCFAYNAVGTLMKGTDANLPDSSAQDRSREKVHKIKLSNMMGQSYLGFTWEPMACTISDEGISISCAMSAVRNWGTMFSKEVVPGIAFLIIGFASFLLPPGAHMPRIATCMIAALSLMGKSVAVFEKLPAVGRSWLEDFYVFGSWAMLFNLLGHIASFRLPQYAVAIGDVALSIGFFLYVVILCIVLHARGCEKQLSPTISATCVTLATFVLFAAIVVTSWRFRRSFLSARNKHKKSKDEEEEVEGDV